MTREDLGTLESIHGEAVAIQRDELRDLLALAREALDARETYRLERSFAGRSHWEPLWGHWSGLRGIEAARMARGWCAESHGPPWVIQIVRERDGEAVT